MGAAFGSNLTKKKVTLEEAFKMLQDTIKSEHVETRNLFRDTTTQVIDLLEILSEELKKKIDQ
jgi:7,8-dihydro-6-hydroxymethylpterin-pyrophosphokinase